MADFTPITTQDQFDAAIGDRLKRERDSLTKKYGDYDDLKNKVADYEKQISDLGKTIESSSKKYAGYDKTLAELQSKVKGYETSSVKRRVAHDAGIPYELADRISGETEEDIRRDAESLAKFLGSKNPPAPPLKSTEPVGVYSSIHGAFANTKHQPRMLNSPDTVKMAAGQYVNNDD
jgi:hypothetical protein